MNLSWIGACGLAVLCGSVSVSQAHYDALISYNNGTISVGGVTHQGETVSSMSVFGYDFGETSVDPYNLDDPGFGAISGSSGIPANAIVRLQITSSLKYWDGTGEVNFTNVSAGAEYIHLFLGSSSASLTGSSGNQFVTIAQADGSGYIHSHLNSSLYAAPGTSNQLYIDTEDENGDPITVLNPDLVDPDSGIYAYSARIVITSGGVNYYSDTLWYVFNNGLTEEQHDAAMESLAAVPEPAALATLGIGALTLLTRRKR